MMRHLLFMVVMVGCAAPDPSELYHQLEVQVTDAEADEAFIDAVLASSQSLHIALPDGENEALLGALLTRWQEVEDDPEFVYEVIFDYDDREDPGVAALIDAGAPVTLADDGVAYFEFAVGDDVSWTSEQTIMSHAYAIVDEVEVVAATTAGHTRPGPRVLLTWQGEDLIEDLWWEHNQIYGGTDAVETTAFNGPAKSITDVRWQYGTQTDAMLQMWFGPQERLTKRVVDATYSARSAVWVVTDRLDNSGLWAALQEKASFGFDVWVVTREGQTPDTAPDVEVRRVTGEGELPTVVVVDVPEDREGYAPHARAMMITHPLVSSARLERGREVINDQFIDGAMWVLSDRTDDRATLTDLVDLVTDLYEQGAP